MAVAPRAAIAYSPMCWFLPGIREAKRERGKHALCMQNRGCTRNCMWKAPRPNTHWIAARQTGKGGKAHLIHKPGDLPTRRPSVGRVNQTEADFRTGDNLVAVRGDCQTVIGKIHTA